MLSLYVVAGKADDPNAAHAEFLSKQIELVVPNVSIEVQLLNPKEWPDYFAEVVKQHGFTGYPSDFPGPLIWTPVGELVGSTTEFRENVYKKKFGLARDINVNDENLFEEIAKKNMASVLAAEKRSKEGAPLSEKYTAILEDSVAQGLVSPIEDFKTTDILATSVPSLFKVSISEELRVRYARRRANTSDFTLIPNALVFSVVGRDFSHNCLLHPEPITPGHIVLVPRRAMEEENVPLNEEEPVETLKEKLKAYFQDMLARASTKESMAAVAATISEECTGGGEQKTEEESVEDEAADPENGEGENNKADNEEKIGLDDIDELRNLKEPQAEIMAVIIAVAHLLNAEAGEITYPDAIQVLSDPKLFVDRILNFDSDDIPALAIHRVVPIMSISFFNFDAIKPLNVVAAHLALWVQVAMRERISRDPKKFSQIKIPASGHQSLDVLDFGAIEEVVTNIPNTICAFQHLIGPEEHRHHLDKFINTFHVPDYPTKTLFSRERGLSGSLLEPHKGTGKDMNTAYESAMERGKIKNGVDNYTVLVSSSWVLVAKMRNPSTKLDEDLWRKFPPLPPCAYLGLLFAPTIEVQFPESCGETLSSMIQPRFVAEEMENATENSDEYRISHRILEKPMELLLLWSAAR